VHLGRCQFAGSWDRSVNSMQTARGPYIFAPVNCTHRHRPGKNYLPPYVPQVGAVIGVPPAPLKECCRPPPPVAVHQSLVGSRIYIYNPSARSLYRGFQGIYKLPTHWHALISIGSTKRHSPERAKYMARRNSERRGNERRISESRQ
jgi:hypothetical protein